MFKRYSSRPNAPNEILMNAPQKQGFASVGFQSYRTTQSVPAPTATVVGGNHMSQMLEWRERLESAHKQLQDAMTELINHQ